MFFQKFCLPLVRYKTHILLILFLNKIRKFFCVTLKKSSSRSVLKVWSQVACFSQKLPITTEFQWYSRIVITATFKRLYHMIFCHHSLRDCGSSKFFFISSIYLFIYLFFFFGKETEICDKRKGLLCCAQTVIQAIAILLWRWLRLFIWNWWSLHAKWARLITLHYFLTYLEMLIFNYRINHFQIHW